MHQRIAIRFPTRWRRALSSREPVAAKRPR